jgi:hypothetical protein
VRKWKHKAPSAAAVVFASSCLCPKTKFSTIYEQHDISKFYQQAVDTADTELPSLALAFDRASLLLPLDLFQTFARTSIMGGAAAHQWIRNFLAAGQITKSIPQLE